MINRTLLLILMVWCGAYSSNYFIDSLASKCVFGILPKNRYLADNPVPNYNGNFNIYNGGRSTATLTGTFYNLLVNVHGYTPSNQGSIILDGVDGYMSIGNSLGNLSSGRLTVSMWLTQSTLGATAIFFNWQVDANNRFTISSYNNAFYFGVLDGSIKQGYFNITGMGLSNNTPFHIVLKLNLSAATNAEKMKVYLNDTLRTLTFGGTLPSTFPNLSSATASIGYSSTSLNGRIDNLLWFDDTLSITRIDSLYSIGSNLGGIKYYTNSTLRDNSACTHITDLDFVCRDSTVRKIDISYPNDADQHTLLFVGHGFIGQKEDVTRAWRDRLCDMGFVVAAITTRKDAGGLEIYDFYDALKFVESNYSSRLNGRKAFVGYSGGGGNAYSIFTKMPDLFDFVVSHFGMNDYEWFYNYSVPLAPTCSTYVGGRPDQVPNNYLARKSQAVISNTKGRGKIIILHDTSDISVSVLDAYRWKIKSDSLGYTNYSYNVSKTGDYWRILHGYPTSGNSGEYINQFEKNITPRWVDTVLSASLPVKGINSSDTLIVPAFVRTEKFAVILGNSHRAKVYYNAGSRLIKLFNNDTRSNITNGVAIWSGFAPGRTCKVTVDSHDSLYTVNSSGEVPVYFNLAADSIATFKYSLKSTGNNKPSIGVSLGL